MYRSFCLATALASLIAFASAQAASSERHQGHARLIDGDTIVIDDQAIRLNGIDTPESAQRCLDEHNKEYRCGKSASDALNRLIRGRPVLCIGSERDDYGRLIAECSAGETSLNREMVRLGWAVAYEEYTDRYLPEAIEARKANRGIWRGEFTPPKEFRKERWEVSQEDAPNGCPIKGNISDRGKIYHTPWSQYYTRTKITRSKGELWFCDENEAVQAGWRAPYR